METYSPIKVKIFPDYKLCITFENKENRIFDMKPYLEDKYFAPLKDISKFKTARINPITIEWDGEIDICPDELYHNSVPLISPTSKRTKAKKIPNYAPTLRHK